MTDWLDYDTAYTERYLGTLPENTDAYSQSSVLQYAANLPSELVTITVLIVFYCCLCNAACMQQWTSSVNSWTM